MKLFDTSPVVDIVAASGRLRVTLYPRISYLFVDVELFRYCWQGPILFRVFWIWAVVSGPLGLLFQFSGTEVIEFDEKKLTLTRDFHGWERHREYLLEDCSELDWVCAAEGTPSSMRCKTRWSKIRFAKYVSEDQATQILAALQEFFPQVASRICAQIGSKTRFITLDLRE